MKYLIKIGFLTFWLVIGYVASVAQQNRDFKILQDKEQIGAILNFHSRYLGMGVRYALPEAVPPWLRMPEIKTPGDYYRHPAGANEVTLNESEVQEVKNALTGNIRNQFYNSYVLQNLKGYAYELFLGDINRREYFVKYSRGDTIYVISGLIGKFLSFYRSLPGKDVISIDQLKKEVEKLSPSIKLKNENPIIKKANEHIYFNEYIDREQKVRIRNYQIVESWQEGDKDRDDSIGKYYNLIEITKFLDEEAMP